MKMIHLRPSDNVCGRRPHHDMPNGTIFVHTVISNNLRLSVRGGDYDDQDQEAVVYLTIAQAHELGAALMAAGN